MEAPSHSFLAGPTLEMAALPADVREAKAALKRANEERARGYRDKVSACRQMLIESQRTLNLLYEKNKRLAAGTEGKRAM